MVFLNADLSFSFTDVEEPFGDPGESINNYLGKQRSQKWNRSLKDHKNHLVNQLCLALIERCILKHTDRSVDFIKVRKVWPFNIHHSIFSYGNRSKCKRHF
jgi:hypothetical protein